VRILDSGGAIWKSDKRQITLEATMPTYKTLSVRQPYAWLLVNGIKTCENRTWNTKHRGTLVIHAGAKSMTMDDWGYLIEMCEARQITVPWFEDPCLETGGIVGAVRLVDVTASPEPNQENGWWDGESFAWLLDGAMTIPDFIPLKGRLGLFDVELPFEIQWEKAQTEA
jgi:hypothetical protein